MFLYIYDFFIIFPGTARKVDFEVIHYNETHQMHAYFIPIQKWKHFYIKMERKCVLIKSKAIHL